ncbi:integrase DNA-binding domain-containing protein [Listeria monocytogenes]|nr:integrase DNA-binding domain-containing protein [Listeria monocytogenes]
MHSLHFLHFSSYFLLFIVFYPFLYPLILLHFPLYTSPKIQSGESQRKDGRYLYKYVDSLGESQFIEEIDEKNFRLTCS